MDVATSVTSGAPGRRLRAWLDLGKLRIVELWLGFFVGVSLLGFDRVTQLRPIAILATILVAGIAVIAVTCSLDDITGVRDGVDQANHRDGTRWGVRKPILDGRLSEPAALRFVAVAGAVAIGGVAAAIALAWPLPGWFVALTLALILVAVNYSYVLRLSYHGAGELAIALGGAGTVLVPYGLVAGALDPVVVFQAALVGSWHAQVVVFSNSHDAPGDRATGRMTVAARTSEAGNARFILAAFAICWAVQGALVAAGAVPRWHAAALAPVWALQAVQLWRGVGRRQWLRARRLGFRILRVGIVALVAANLVARS